MYRKKTFYIIAYVSCTMTLVIKTVLSTTTAYKKYKLLKK